ncbi:MAG TPA: amidohydrolase [Mariprofundaceae bacterium]|nr:amidohydrolase [Mariprofundaceae bacterium]
MKHLDQTTLSRTAAAVLPDIIKIRRHLHQHPERSGDESRTADYLAGHCRQLGLDVRTGIGGHGLLAKLQIDPTLPWLALRADMDALPIHDRKSTDYASQRQGVSHACGHDVHAAMLLGAAMVIRQLQRHLQCNVAFIFQPAEETSEGAAKMLKDGVLKDIAPLSIHALHVYPYLPAGSIGLRTGIVCAAADSFDVEVVGRGGHAARPHECIDVILVASHIVQALHHIISRRVNPLHPAVLTIGQIHAGHAANVIPERVRFSGTVRSLNPEDHEEIRSRIDRIVRQTAESWGATASFTLHQATPMLCNDPQILAKARQTFERLLPATPLIDISDPSMGGEDFAEFLQSIPGCLYRLGTGSGPETRYPLHHPNFDIDESAMLTGVLALASLVLDT